MTDKQIIKYWNEIDSEIINEHGEEFDVYITMPVAKSTVDLINRQKAEIKRLRRENKLLSQSADTAFQDGLDENRDLFEKEVRPEIVKEFAERLKTNFNKNIKLYGRCTVCDATTEIDNLVKEMTEVQG